LPLAEQGSNDELLKEVMKLVGRCEGIKVRANADTPEAAKKALEYGAKGIGLIRTEHMFFSDERILEMRKMILAANIKERAVSLEKLEKFQERDFYEILKVMGEYPVIVRYLDPPLHEFLPKEDQEILACANSLGIDAKTISDRIEELKEVNPMMGFRGCRLGIKYPEISVMQTRALVKAMIRLAQEGIQTHAEMMVPLTTDIREFIYIKNLIDGTAKKLMEEFGTNVEYKVGTMIETPRAALMSQQISKYADFYSFGTNDLTQLTYGLSRDDAGKFLDNYYNKQVYTIDPFKTLDQDGVGMLMEIAVTSASRKIEMGICGEHGGDEASIRYAESIGLDYVSCSPFRVPTARLISAKIKIENDKRAF